MPSSFFDPENPEAAKTRKELAKLALEDMLTWFATGSDQEDPGKVTAGFGMVAVYDATNSSIDRRHYLAEECEKAGVQTMFIESYCDDKDIIMTNIREVKISSPDYVDVDPMKAVEDFICRIQHYEKRYQTLTSQENVPFIKLVNVGKEVTMYKIQGYLQSRICFFLMNLNIVPRHIYFVRHGESEFNVLGRIGGDANLSSRGEAFASKLPDLIEELLTDSESSPDSSAFDQHIRARTSSMQSINGSSLTEYKSGKQLSVWTSTLKRTIQTASHLSYPKFQWKQLDELDSGVCDGLTYEEIEELYPEDFHDRDRDKFNYRYKGGESYRDLVQRLEPVIMELERHHEDNHGKPYPYTHLADSYSNCGTSSRVTMYLCLFYESVIRKIAICQYSASYCFKIDSQSL
jgi:6-phosphofructo-2-kinase/fructose-2,6-biphosphatase 2